MDPLNILLQECINTIGQLQARCATLAIEVAALTEQLKKLEKPEQD